MASTVSGNGYLMKISGVQFPGYFNGIYFPAPVRGLNEIIATNVDSARNARGTVIGEVVGRDIYKINNIEWEWLSAEQVAVISQLFSSFFVVATIFDMATGGRKTIKMYPGNRTGEPYWLGADGLPITYKSYKVNIIDCGVI